MKLTIFLSLLTLALAQDDPCACSSAADRIVGGERATKGQFPWQAGLMYKWSQNNKPWCGGSLINSEWVLTAAHCVDGDKAEQLQVNLGAHNWKRNKPPAQEMQVAEIIVHEDYDDWTLDNDIALLRLSSAPTCGDKVSGVCITSTEPSSGTMVTVSGWGTLKSGGRQPRVLYHVTVPVVDSDTCNLPTWYDGEVNPHTMICAGLEEGGKDSCQGDSGGPVVLEGTNELVGIVSWGYGCAAPNYPGVYTNVANYVDWIESKINP